ncbi:hypothetical protein V2H45_17035 [Tumidithrix elongata RA019]|uniref:Uncharacterized protein n=1 Tax=Tumidithrix elongata BACA0141 TaxID=2716417 RepID=A0AAW9Q5H3_9CYAN|nr:hypothetical protein [Tumidithrix elongata RA019]
MDLITACDNIEDLRAWVHKHLAVGAADGNFWLPIVWTARGPLYAEVITQQPDGKYQQPFHLPDKLRQPLYDLGYRLLSHLKATPSVYLMQFSLSSLNALEDAEVLFDRLIPFPDEPAIASVGVQEPNLFTCHWLCLTNRPIYDLVIR